MTLFETVQGCVDSSSIKIHRRDITAKILESFDAPGDYLEIGGDEGKNTVILLDIAKRQNKIVHVIDPWTIINHDFDSWDAGVDVYQEYFLKNVAGYDNVKAYRCSSADEVGISVIEKLDLCFAYLDGGYLDWPRVTQTDTPTRNYGDYPVDVDRLLHDFKAVSQQFTGSGVISISNVGVCPPHYDWHTGERIKNERCTPIYNCIKSNMVSDTWKVVDVPYLYTNIFLVKDK